MQTEKTIRTKILNISHTIELTPGPVFSEWVNSVMSIS